VDEELTKIITVVTAAVLVGAIGLAVKGIFGGVMGFILTIFVIALFTIWKKN
jgi:hypothetical protein